MDALIDRDTSITCTRLLALDARHSEGLMDATAAVPLDALECIECIECIECGLEGC